MTRVIILAAGEGTRWGNYRDVPKHLVKIEKEVLLHRTAKQFLKYTDDVCIIGADERYKVDGTALYVVKAPNTNWKDGAKFMSSQYLWNKSGRTVLVFGDVYFTNDAVKTIMSNNDGFKFFLRRGASEITGGRWKEIFAVSFDSRMIKEITQKLLMLISQDQVQRQAGWALYKSMIGPMQGDMFNNSHYVEIDDWTEDFDFPEDLDTWEEKRKLARKNKNM